MDYLFVSNGKTELVLIPKSELDRQLLAKLFDESPVEVVKVSQPLGVLGQSVQDSFIIRKKNVDDNS